MGPIFIEHIHINKVRHLSGIDIPLSSQERKHLILTGRNGSGKTSTLWAIKNYLSDFNNIGHVPQWRQQVSHWEELIKQEQSRVAESEFSETDRQETISRIGHHQANINGYRQALEPYDSLTINLKNLGYISFYYQEGNFVTAFFNAKRDTSLNKPTGINKVEIKNIYSLEEIARTNFIQYIVNLKADRSFARDENDMISVGEIDEWFEKFEQGLREIFDDEKLRLEFDRKNYNFNIVLGNRETFDLNTLSDGYSAIMSIVTELILRMENKSSRVYDIQGIVLIDEIETHLHIELQKKILPFLTNFFPNIQFIVTSHSPFVLGSLENAVVYDLEKRILVEDLTGYSVEAIIESYFDSDKYSDKLKKEVVEYEQLLNLTNPIEEQKERREFLIKYFRELPKFMAPEFELKINQLELASIQK